MKRTKFQRLAALILALTFIMGGALTVSAENAMTPNSSVTDSSIADIQEQLSAISYEEYSTKYADVPGASSEIVIDATQYDKENTNAKVEVQTYDGVEALYTPADGTTVWKVNVPAEAKYSILIEYYPVEGKAASIERVFRLNGEIPFAEARYLTLAKIYANEYPNGEILLNKASEAGEYLAAAAAAGITATTEERENGTYVVYTMPEYWTSDSAALVDENLIRFFTHDIEGNELRQTMEQTPVWSIYDVKDANGFYAENFDFVLRAGENTLSLEAKNEPMAIKSIRLVPHESLRSYEDYLAQYAGAAKGSDYIKIEAESTRNTSSKTIYAVEDRSSAACSPTDPAHQLLNTIGGEKWQTAGQWATYSFKVKESGMYSVGVRFRQNVLDGMYTSRALYIYSEGLEEGAKGYYDGIPYAEAAALRFAYNDGWQSTLATNADDPLEFYFEKDVVYTLKLEVTLGSMGDIVRRVDAALDSINDDYLQILKLTGANPDEYRDYGFSRVMPDTLNDMVKQAFVLDEISEQLVEVSGEKSSQSATLDKISWLLKKMGRDEDEVAANMEQLKSYIGTLGTWLGDAKTQPLQVDYITIQSAEAAAPKATPGFFKALSHECVSFFWSFFRDYNHMGSLVETSDDETVEVWLAYGRDQSQVIRSLINNDFTPQTGISVNLKLVAGSTLLPSVLSGMGPDLYIGLGQGDVINYAIRGALDHIDQLEGFDEVTKNFNEAAMMVLGIEDSSGEYHVYGLPETQNFNMMFVREDILAELNIEIPKTWDDILAAIPILQANNMQIGMHTEYKIFLYQMGGELFADDGMRINLDSNVALTAFEKMCNMFTMYGFPYTYDFSNRFRTGEMPIGIASYVGTYNQLKVFATEIEGCWGFYPLPGEIDPETGEINNVSVSTASAIVMLSGSDPKLKDKSWEFMKWQVGAHFQTEYANEMVAIIGPSAKQATANIDALASLTWTTEEYNQVALQFNNLASIPNYPGSYIIDRYTSFAFLDAYNDNEDPVDSLLSYITTINKEITRKRSEFELETVDYVGQTLLEKRMLQATDALDADIEAIGDTAAYAELIAAARSAIEVKDSVALSNAAAQLQAANATAFAETITALQNASVVAAKYEVNSWSR
ncbi:MAG: extracellular solute-binding protein [Clostridia bacterium]|nr:extracellular solute-binding protein [Clostridia bacterium]